MEVVDPTVLEVDPSTIVDEVELVLVVLDGSGSGTTAGTAGSPATFRPDTIASSSSCVMSRYLPHWGHGLEPSMS